MRNPKRKREISATVFVAAVVTGAVSIQFMGGAPQLGAWFGILIVAFHIAIIAFVFVVVYHLASRRRERLLRGENLVARWEISPHEWNEFLKAEPQRNTVHPMNSLKVKPESAAAGIAVYLSRKALMVDDDVYHFGTLRGFRWVEGSPNCVEFKMVTSGRGQTVHWLLRFPVAATAEAGARAVCDYFGPIYKQ